LSGLCSKKEEEGRSFSELNQNLASFYKIVSW
jgi:hypothetical protein